MAPGNPTSEQSRSLKMVLTQEGTFPPSAALALCHELLRQVCALHAAGTTHRAIGPDSVLVDLRGHVALAAVEPVQLLDGADAGMDSCPPELAGAGVVRLPASIDAAREELERAGIALDPRRIDVYQLGTLLCQVLTGASVSRYLCSPKARSRVPAPLRPLIDRALGHNPADRLADCDAFAEVLSAFVPESAVERTPHGDSTGSTARFPASAGSSGFSSPPDGPLPFARLAHYRIDRRIGRGGMGDVYLGYEEALQRSVAIKVLPALLARDEGLVRRFQAEATAAARLSHANLVPIHFIGQDAGHHFFVMPYVDGESLHSLLARQGRLDVDRALSILEQCLEGLAVAHHAGLIHRDVKPANILLDGKTGRALLADFGLVKTSGSGLTDAGTVLGTLDYIAPEQALAHAVDGRADLYALGVVAYQMLSGRLPFRADTASAMLFQHAYGTPTPLTVAAPEVPPPLAALVDRMMARDPAARYPNCAEVLADLRRWRAGAPLAACATAPELVVPSQGQPSEASRPGDTARLRVEEGPDRLRQRRPWLAAGTVAAVLLVGGGLLLAWKPWRTHSHPAVKPPQTQEPPRAQPREEAPAQPPEKRATKAVYDKIDGDLITAAAFSPDVRRLLIADTRLRVWDWKNRGVRNFAIKLSGPVRALVWSADGRRALVGGSEIRAGKQAAGVAFLVDISTGQVLTTCRGHDTPVCAVALSADGAEILTAGELPENSSPLVPRGTSHQVSAVVRRWNAATGRERSRYLGPAAPVHSIAFSQDRRRIFAAGGADDPALYSWDAQSAVAVRIPYPTRPKSDVALSADGSKVAFIDTRWRFHVQAVVDGKQLKEVCHSNPLSRMVNGSLVSITPQHTAWSRDGRYLVFSSRLEANEPGKAPLFFADAASGRVLHEMEGHQGETKVLAVSDNLNAGDPNVHDLRYILSCAKDGFRLEFVGIPPNHVLAVPQR